MSRRGQKYSKYKKCLRVMMLIYIKQHLAPFEAQFMRKLSHSEAKLKKAFLIKKACVRKLQTNPNLTFLNVIN